MLSLVLVFTDHNRTILFSQYIYQVHGAFESPYVAGEQIALAAVALVVCRENFETDVQAMSGVLHTLTLFMILPTRATHHSGSFLD